MTGVATSTGTSAPTASLPGSSHGRLGVVTGTVMLLGAVLGPGALALPALAAEAAGPASLLAWGLLLCASVPVAATFASLGGSHPDGGGVAHFARLAFGERVAVPVGWWFLAAVPIGVMAAALMGGHYMAAALGAGQGASVWIGLALLAAAFALNSAGLAATGRVQVLTAGVLVVLLAVTVVASSGNVRASAFSPFAPQGWGGVATAANVLFFAFAGWEAATHLSGDFADAGRGLRRATALTLGIVVVLYVGLAVVTVGVLGDAAGSAPVPLLALLRQAFGPMGTALTTAAALLLTFGAINAYLASGARLGAALGRDGVLPRWLVGSTREGREPRHALAFLAVCCLLLAGPALRGLLGLDVLVRATSALLAAVTLVGTLVGVRLLRGGRRITAAAASAFLVVVVLCSGRLLLVPLLVGVAASAKSRRSPARARRVVDRPAAAAASGRGRCCR